MPASTPMMAITTSSSISVNACPLSLNADALFMIPSLVWCLATHLCYSQVACQERGGVLS